MDENKKSRIRRNITIVSFVILIGVIAVAVYLGITHQENLMLFNILMVSALAVFWILMDVVLPIVTKEAEGKTPEEIRNLRFISLLDLVGYAGLGYFVIAREQNSGIYGAVVFLLATMYKRKLRNGDAGAGEDEEESSAQENPGALEIDQTDDSEQGSESGQPAEQETDSGSVREEPTSLAERLKRLQASAEDEER